MNAYAMVCTTDWASHTHFDSRNLETESEHVHDNFNWPMTHSHRADRLFTVQYSQSKSDLDFVEDGLN